MAAAATKSPKTKTPPPAGGPGYTPFEQFSLARKAMSDALVEREGEIDCVLTAMLCNEHSLFVGPPGTAKSLLLDSVMRWMGHAPKFSVLLTKFTTPEEVFGPISVEALKRDQYRRVTAGRLPEASLAFIDEVFKGSSAILNTLLRLLNERVYDNGEGVFRPVPLQTCVAASNEWPGDDGGGKELGAVFDRFLFRRQVQRVRTPAGVGTLLWSTTEELTPDFGDNVLTLQALADARKAAAAVPFGPEAVQAMHALIPALAQEGIRPGDRRLRKGVAAAKAAAFLRGADEVKPDHLMILKDIYWEDPQEQPRTAEKVIQKVCNPTQAIIDDLLMKARQVSDSPVNQAEKVSKLNAIRRELDKLPASAEAQSRAVRAVQSLMKDIYEGITGGGSAAPGGDMYDGHPLPPTPPIWSPNQRPPGQGARP